MKVEQLLANVPHSLLQGSPDAEVTGICHDTRTVRPGDAFVCVRGARLDTHDRVAQVAAAGAALLVVDEDVELPEDVTVARVEDTRAVTSELAAAFYGRPAERMVTVGITGSKGKTTTTHMLADILRAAGHPAGTIGTNGAIMPRAGAGLPAVPGASGFKAADCVETPGYVCYELANTTPDAIELQMYLAMMVASGCTHVVLEVSSQAMKLHRADAVTFDFGIWTNIEEGDHVGPGEHASFEEYMTCKAAMLDRSRVGFLNADDPHYQRFREHVSLPEERLFTFGGPGADCRGTNLVETFDERTELPGIAFDFEDTTGVRDGVRHFRVSLPGAFNMHNAMAALCVADRLGVSDEDANRALTHLRIRGRFDLVWDKGGVRVCVDFAHNGYSARNHLQALRYYRPKRVVCVFGADGNRSRYRRTEMGEASARYADLSVVTAGHNRWETFEAICSDILKGIETAEADMGHQADWIVIPDRERAIRFAIEHARPGDMITILGLGHESYQEERGVKRPHSDIDYARAVCEELLG